MKDLSDRVKNMNHLPKDNGKSWEGFRPDNLCDSATSPIITPMSQILFFTFLFIYF